MKRSTSSDDDQSVVIAESACKFTKIRRLMEEGEDHISKLPDDILVSILSLMTKGGEIEQVVRTSVLSWRWRPLWKYSLKSSSLTFTFKENYNSPCKLAVYKKFVNRVNHILALPIYSDAIDDFNLMLKSDSRRQRYKSDLHGWIDFVLQKRVKRLSINLDLHSRITLDHEVIRSHNIDSLVSLCLKGVHVTGEFLEYLLTLCGSLQHLSVTWSTSLVDFTVHGTRLKLKYLKIWKCLGLRRLCIRDVNLVSFVHSDDPRCSVVIENSPHLVNAHIYNSENTAKFLSNLPQLQTLVVEFSYGTMNRPALQFPKLSNLVQLELRAWAVQTLDLNCDVCASLLVSCPSIRELKLVFRGLIYTDGEDKAAEKLEHPHECLKVVEIVGFIGCKLDTQVALYIIENTVSLDTFIVDTRKPWRSSDSREGARATAREHMGTRLLHTSTKLVLK